MKLEITEKKENKAMQRNEVLFKIEDAKITPSRKELKPKIAAMLNTKEQLVVIKKVSHPFGGREATITVNAYQNEATLKKLEPKHLIERDSGKKKEKKEEKPAKDKETQKAKGKQAEAKEEKAEEKKEEKQPEKAEEKPSKEEEKKAEEPKEEKEASE